MYNQVQFKLVQILLKNSSLQDFKMYYFEGILKVCAVFFKNHEVEKTFLQYSKHRLSVRELKCSLQNFPDRKKCSFLNGAANKLHGICPALHLTVD